MASKEEIEKRVQDEAQSADDRYTKHKGDVVRSFQAAVRPLVERVIELEELGQREVSARMMAEQTAANLEGLARDERERNAAKLAAAEERVIEQGRTIEVLNADRSRLAADLVEARSDLVAAQRELNEEVDQRRPIAPAHVERARLVADLTEARAELRTATREHDSFAAALRAQVAALQGVIDGHEQAIRDACTDVRAEYEDERATDRARRTRLVDTIAALETTVDVLAGRLAARGA